MKKRKLSVSEMKLNYIGVQHEVEVKTTLKSTPLPQISAKRNMFYNKKERVWEEPHSPRLHKVLYKEHDHTYSIIDDDENDINDYEPENKPENDHTYCKTSSTKNISDANALNKVEIDAFIRNEVDTQTFDYRENESIIQLVPTEPQYYKCLLCDRSFIKLSKFLNHQQTIHTDKKPYSCNFCDQTFTQKSNLTNHQKVHTNEKNTYFCEFCSKLFSSKSQFTSHQRIHTGEKPYNCLLCNRSFAHSSSFRYHMKTGHILVLMDI